MDITEKWPRSANIASAPTMKLKKKTQKFHRKVDTLVVQARIML